MGDDNEDGIYMHGYVEARVLQWAVGLVDKRENIKTNSGSIQDSNPRETHYWS